MRLLDNDFMDKLKEAFDAETGKVLCAAIAPWLAVEHIDLLFRVLASIGAAVFIWRKILKKKD